MLYIGKCSYVHIILYYPVCIAIVSRVTFLIWEIEILNSHKVFVYPLYYNDMAHCTILYVYLQLKFTTAKILIAIIQPSANFTNHT
jgi:hypothetical protein